MERNNGALTWQCFMAFTGSDSGTVPTSRDLIRDCMLFDPQTAQSALNNRLSLNAPSTCFDLYLYKVYNLGGIYRDMQVWQIIIYVLLTGTLLNQMLYNQSTGRFIMYSGITKIYCRKTAGHVFTKPVQIERTTQFFSVSFFFSS